MDWGQVAVTALASNTVTALGWIAHTFWLGPWAEKRKVVAKEKREHELELLGCHNCHGDFPRWFMDVSIGPPPHSDHVEVYCRVCTDKEHPPPRYPHPYEDEAMFNRATLGWFGSLRRKRS